MVISSKNTPNKEVAVITALLIEDNTDDANLILESIKDIDTDEELEIKRVDRLAAGLSCLADSEFDVVLLDMNLPDSSGLDTFLSVHVSAPYVPVVIISGNQDLEVANQAVYQGAEDYLVKGQFSGNQLSRSIHFAISRHARSSVAREMQKANAGFAEMVQVMRKLRSQAEQITNVVGDINATIQGDKS